MDARRRGGRSAARLIPGALAVCALVGFAGRGNGSSGPSAGHFFVNERYVLDDANGTFGAATLGLSAHSTVLHDWAEGGPIALHGTNQPSLIGTASSQGCVRLRNADVARVLKLTPAGTPVVILG